MLAGEMGAYVLQLAKGSNEINYEEKCNAWFKKQDIQDILKRRNETLICPCDLRLVKLDGRWRNANLTTEDRICFNQRRVLKNIAMVLIIVTARTHARTYARTHVRTQARTHTCTHAHMHTRTYAHTYAGTQVPTRTHAHTLIRARIHTHVWPCASSHAC